MLCSRLLCFSSSASHVFELLILFLCRSRSVLLPRVHRTCAWIYAVIAQTQPQSAYCALTQALRREWSFLCRCLDMPRSWLEPVELAVRNRLIPALTSGSPPNDSLRGVLAQPCRLGGLGIVDRCHHPLSAAPVFCPHHVRFGESS